MPEIPVFEAAFVGKVLVSLVLLQKYVCLFWDVGMTKPISWVEIVSPAINENPKL